MTRETLEMLEREITQLRRRYGALLREQPEACEVTPRWAEEVAGLCWFVPLADVVEPDIDVEITTELLVVRAHRAWPDPALLVGLLPVPRGFDSDQPVIRLTEETLEVRIRRVHRGTA
jgi:hypothetical protein